MRSLSAAFLAISIVLSMTGCISPCPQVDPQLETISRLDDYLIPLAKAVDVIADKLPPDAKDDEIFKAVVERSGNSKLFEPFKEFKLKSRIQDGTGVILVCTKDEKEGIIEDVSCTTRPDTHRPSGSPCIYLLDVKAVCVYNNLGGGQETINGFISSLLVKPQYLEVKSTRTPAPIPD